MIVEKCSKYHRAIFKLFVGLRPEGYFHLHVRLLGIDLILIYNR